MRNRDTELFYNMLGCAKKFKVPLEFFLFEAIRFCAKNGKWTMLRELTNQYPRRLSYKGKNAISFLNFNLAKENLEEGRPEKAKKFLEEIFAKKIILK